MAGNLSFFPDGAAGQLMKKMQTIHEIFGGGPARQKHRQIGIMVTFNPDKVPVSGGLLRTSR